MPEGIDYAFGGPPSISALRSAGVKFVCRYLSHSPSKNLTPAEARTLSAAGIWIVVVWETTAKRAIAGRAAGYNDAIEARAQARACGMPDGRPVYFAVDWDASSSQQAAINDYLDGAASVLGRDQVGIYGGYGPVKRALDGGHATWAWQTYAWSGGRWDSRAQLQQYSNDHTLGGVGCDYDRATKPLYGQWRVGVTPAQEEVEMIARDVLEGLDKKTQFPIPPGTTTVMAFADNSYTNTTVKATGPVKLRFAVKHDDGSAYQVVEKTVGRVGTDASKEYVSFPLSNAKHAVAISVIRLSGDGTEPLTAGAY